MNKQETVNKAVDMLVNYCADNDIGLRGTLVFEIDGESFVDHLHVIEEETI